MAELRLLKLIVQVVVIEVDDEGNFIGERLSDPTVFYREAEAVDFISNVQGNLANAQIGGNNGIRDKGNIADRLRQPELSGD